MAPFKDLTGKQFGKLTVIKRSDFRGNGKQPVVYWDCLCECGKTPTTKGYSLVSGEAKSCGCRKRTTHKMTNTREYKAWQRMKVRVSDAEGNHKKYYFDKGIDIDPLWEKSFEAFYEDMGAAPSDNHSIDRIDNSKGYWKFNCRWATRKQQQRNRDCNRLITYKGKTQCIADWADELGIERALIDHRLLDILTALKVR